MPLIPFTPETAAATLRDSRDRGALVSAGYELAATTQEQHHQPLRTFLTTPADLEVIDPAGELHQRLHDAPLWTILRELAANPSPASAATVSALCAAPAMSATPDRIDLLIDTTATVRPATPEIIAFWKKHEDPEDIHLTRIGPAAFTNASPPAFAYLLELLRNPKLEDAQVQAWMRRFVMGSRTKPEFIAFADAMIRDEARPLAHRLFAAEALFDYEREWFHPHLAVKKPEWATAAAKDRDSIRAIAAYIRDTWKPDTSSKPRLDPAITATLAEFDALDAARKGP